MNSTNVYIFANRLFEHTDYIGIISLMYSNKL